VVAKVRGKDKERKDRAHSGPISLVNRKCENKKVIIMEQNSSGHRRGMELSVLSSIIGTENRKCEKSNPY
jgi:hypothetical protein